MPGNLCNSYRRGKSKSRGKTAHQRTIRRGRRPRQNRKATGKHTDTHQHSQLRLHGQYWLWQSNPNPLQRSRPLAISIALHPTDYVWHFPHQSPPFSFFLVQKPQNYIGPGSCRRSWWCCCCPKAKSPQPNLNLSPGLVMLIFNLRLQPNRKLIV